MTGTGGLERAKEMEATRYSRTCGGGGGGGKDPPPVQSHNLPATPNITGRGWVL